MEHLIDAKEAARILGISQPAVHRLCNRGTLASIWLGSRRVFLRHKVKELAQSEEYLARTRRQNLYTREELEEAGQEKLDLEEESTS